MEQLTVDVVKQFEGVNFALSPKNKMILLHHFPKAEPIPVIYLGFKITDTLEDIKKPVLKHILPVLTGLSPKEVKKIARLLFIDPRNNHVFLKKIQHEVELA